MSAYYVRMACQRHARYGLQMGRRPKADLPLELSQLLKQVGANLRDLRAAKGLTQAELASKSKVSPTTLNEIESRRFRDIRLSTLAALAKVLSVPVVRLLATSDVKVTSKDQARLLKASEDILNIARRITGHD